MLVARTDGDTARFQAVASCLIACFTAAAPSERPFG